jgi:hypothetical protein
VPTTSASGSPDAGASVGASAMSSVEAVAPEVAAGGAAGRGVEDEDRAERWVGRR